MFFPTFTRPPDPYDNRQQPGPGIQQPQPTEAPYPQRPRPQAGYIDVRIDLPRSRFPLREQISIPCTVNSYSKPTVQWRKNGQILASSRRLQVNRCKKLIRYNQSH